MHIFESFTFFNVRPIEVYLPVNILPVSIVLKISLCIKHGWKPCVRINEDFFSQNLLLANLVIHDVFFVFGINCFTVSFCVCLYSVKENFAIILELFVKFQFPWLLFVPALLLEFLEMFAIISFEFFVLLSRSKLD